MLKYSTSFCMVLFIFNLIGCNYLSTKENYEPKKVEFFSIPIGIDTSIITEEGVKITLSKQSLISDQKEIKLKVSTALGIFRMIEENYSTITVNNKLLETDGMIYIETEPITKINDQSPIHVKIPSKSIASEMKIFKGQLNGQNIKWKEFSDIQNNQSLNKISNGKKLFLQYCPSCHNKNLKDDMTGPALGNITLFRDSSYLLNFTKNSGKLISDDNIIANCLYDRWNASVMSSFEFLSNDEINNIYLFIESESRNLEFRKDDIIFLDSCRQDTSLNYFYDKNGNIIDSTFVIDQVYSDTTFTTTIASNIGNLQPRISNSGYYDFSFSEFGWYNVDMFLRKNYPMIENFRITLHGDFSDKINLYAIFKDRKVIIPFEFNNGYYYLLNGTEKQQIAFPLKTKIKIIAIDFNKLENSNLPFGFKEVISKHKDNTYEIKLKNIPIKDAMNIVEN